MVFIWMVQHTHAPVGCFYFIFISLKYNFVASDYKNNTFIASHIWRRLYSPLFGRSKLRSNRCLHFRLLPPFWNWTAASSFQNCGLVILSNLDADWLIHEHTPPTRAIFGETRDADFFAFSRLSALREILV